MSVHARLCFFSHTTAAVHASGMHGPIVEEVDEQVDTEYDTMQLVHAPPPYAQPLLNPILEHIAQRLDDIEEYAEQVQVSALVTFRSLTTM